MSRHPRKSRPSQKSSPVGTMKDISAIFRTYNWFSGEIKKLEEDLARFSVNIRRQRMNCLPISRLPVEMEFEFSLFTSATDGEASLWANLLPQPSITLCDALPPCKKENDLPGSNTDYLEPMALYLEMLTLDGTQLKRFSDMVALSANIASINITIGHKGKLRLGLLLADLTDAYCDYYFLLHVTLERFSSEGVPHLSSGRADLSSLLNRRTHGASGGLGQHQQQAPGPRSL
ncbi:hypothetical protein D9619_003504 [Psilocybe cf. subviscida]|uniref:Uncharacterized protein n=1 Tax=Psilocybe cf. subviscida TaxID=2480587 RepID=A0A8H5EUN2_9AGAR|nr:hypothetical protein D9619_003504 [Psilocybe cf. subviscida]